MSKIEQKPVLIRMPAPLLKKLDASAKKQSRSRTAEVCQLLASGLKLSRTKTNTAA